MVKTKVFYPYSILLFLFLISGVLVASPVAKLEEANELYKKGEFAEAAKLYNELIDEKYFSYRLYYNLGNSYYKQGLYGKAILNYHRAKRIKPNEHDVLFNLKIAESQIRDKVIEVPAPWFKRVVEKTIIFLSVSSWAWLAVLFMAISLFFWILLMSNRLPFTMSLSGMLLGLIISLLSLGAAIGRNQLDQRVEGVLLVAQIPVKSAPSDQGEDVFVIHEGVFIEVLEEYQDWVKIKLKNNNVGWIPSKAFEAI